jgi:hypothetical protein
MPVVAQGVAPDSLRRAIAEVFARPEYRWGPEDTPLRWLRQLLDRFLQWLERARDLHATGFRIGFWALAAILLALLVHVTVIVWRITRPTARTPGRAAGPRGVVPDDAPAHRARAEALARDGRYTEALAHRFVALVLELEERRALTFHPAKTPAEYVREARLDGSGRASLLDLVGRLYGHLFGGLPCDERCYREFAAEAEVPIRHVASA